MYASLGRKGERVLQAMLHASATELEIPRSTSFLLKQIHPGKTVNGLDTGPIR
jgi:hypothetical protein